MEGKSKVIIIDADMPNVGTIGHIDHGKAALLAILDEATEEDMVVLTAPRIDLPGAIEKPAFDPTISARNQRRLNKKRAKKRGWW